MPQTVLLTGPDAPAGLMFCTVCAATWKHAAYAAVAGRAEEAASSREDGLLRLPLPAPGAWMMPPQPAVAWGFFAPFLAPPMGGGFYPGLVPLCWTHLLMLEDRHGGIIPAAASQMPPEHLRGGVILDGR
jgi:hypothetical protein